MVESGDLGSLNSQDWKKLQELADSLEEAWKKGESVDLAKYLPPAGTQGRVAILHELVKTDLECRWRHGQPVVLDYYLEKFPDDLGSSLALSPALVFEEFRIRQVFGDKPPLEQYKARFPQQFPEVERLAELESYTTIDSPGTAKAPPPISAGNTSPPIKWVEPLPPPKKNSAGSTPFAKNNVLAQTEGIALIERIGTGGFAEVWKAQAPGGVLKALKIIIRPFDQAEAQREKEALEHVKNLRHHFLLPIHAFWILEDRLLILMDLADGSLRDRLTQCKKEGAEAIPLPELRTYIHQTAEALDYLHSKRVQHRDIKPENILLAEGNVRVADFGLAKAQGTMHMAAGTFAGTPHYMPPEVWQDKTHPHGDQYSLAATYFELRVGRRLHKGGGLPALMQNVLYETPNLEPLSDAVQHVLLRALSKNPEDRFPSCLAFVDALLDVDVPALPTPPNPVDTLEIGQSVGTIVAGTTGTPLWRQQDTHPQISALPTSGPPRPSWRWRLVKGAAVLGFGALLAFLLTRYGNPGKFSLDTPAPLMIYAGETRKVQIHIKRDNFTDPVQVKLMHDSDILAEASIPGDDTSVTVSLSKANDAAPGKWPIRIEAYAGDSRQDKVLELTVNPLRTLPKLSPAGVFRSREGSKILTLGGPEKVKKYYEHIECMVGDMPVDFVLVPYYGQIKEPFPFYIMVDKVSNNLFAKFSQEPPPVKGMEDGALPRLGVDFGQAYEFSQWLGGPNGALPFADQWDTAAGLYEEKKGDGPFLGPLDDLKDGDIAVKRKLPLPVGTALRDRSWLGCRDMAGNGLEWLRNYKTETELETKKISGAGANVPRQARVLLRGRDFHEPDPLLWDDLKSPESIPFFKEERKDATQLLRIGFRVVVEPHVN